jgi:plastocyanin
MLHFLSRPATSLLACLLVLGSSSARLAAGEIMVIVKDLKGQPVADAVVSLVPLDTAAPPAAAPPAEPVIIAQRGEEFDPYVTVVSVGARVNFPNHDSIRHQVYSLSKTKPFEIPLYGPGTEQTVLFDRPGVIALGCNIHDWMSAYLVVVDTPHHLKTPADGLARLAALPAGRYRLDVWHPRLAGESRRDVVVAAGDAVTQVISVTLKPDRRIRRAPDSGGGGYK